MGCGPMRPCNGKIGMGKLRAPLSNLTRIQKVGVLLLALAALAALIGCLNQYHS